MLDGRTDGDEKWFEIQDLVVDQVQREMIPIGESYIQVSTRSDLFSSSFFDRPETKADGPVSDAKIWERRQGAETKDIVVHPPRAKVKGLSVVA